MPDVDSSAMHAEVWIRFIKMAMAWRGHENELLSLVHYRLKLKGTNGHIRFTAQLILPAERAGLQDIFLR